MAIKKK